MPDSLDARIAELAAAPTDRPLDGLESEVARGVARLRRDARTTRALAPLQVAAAGLALTIGAAAGGAAAMTALHAPPGGAFAGVTQLAPSTLLDDAG
jgi:hypothetical protein